MELMGVIHGLRQLKTKARVTVYSDSQYVINGIEKGWAKKWRANNWHKARMEKVPNADLWARLLEFIEMQDVVRFEWVKGHAGHPENERCDEMAMRALSGDDLAIDEGYIQAAEAIAAAGPARELQAGDACRKCNTTVVKKATKKKQPKLDQLFYYEYFYFCPACKTMYFVEEAKRSVEDKNDSVLFG